MMIYAHQTAPTQFVEANSVRFAYRRFGKTGGVPLCEPPSTVWEPYYRMHYSREQLIDDQTGHRREISKRLIEYAGEIPSLIERLSEVLGLPSLAEPQVVAIESFTERIGSLNEMIRRTVNTEDAPLPYEQALASADRLGEEIATAMVFLDRLLLDPQGN
jgi:hypothetical protein